MIGICANLRFMQRVYTYHKNIATYWFSYNTIKIEFYRIGKLILLQRAYRGDILDLRDNSVSPSCCAGSPFGWYYNLRDTSNLFLKESAFVP